MADFLCNALDKKINIEEKICHSLRDFNLICSDTGFTLFHINIRSIKKNLDELIISLKALNYFPDIIVLTETHSAGELNYNIPGFCYYATTTKLNKNSGIAVFMSNRFKVLNIKEIHNINNANVLNFEFKEQNKYYNIIAIYRTHSSVISQFINELKHILLNFRNKNNIIVGDMNLNIAKDYSSMDKENYLNMLAELNYFSCINSYTRNVRGQRPSCLDHIFTNISDIENIMSAVIHTTITDHYSCIFNYKFNNSTLPLCIGRDIIHTIFCQPCAAGRRQQYFASSPGGAAKRCLTIIVSLMIQSRGCRDPF